MPEVILAKNKLLPFYDSWDFDAVNNANARLFIYDKQWLQLENDFFTWISLAEEMLFPNGKVIFTPYLERDWIVDLPKWGRTKRWIQKQRKEFEERLLSSKILVSPPSFRDNYRGGRLEDFSEVDVLARMSVKNFPLLFLVDGKMVIQLTEYLTVKITFADDNCKQAGNNLLVSLLDPQILSLT